MTVAGFTNNSARRQSEYEGLLASRLQVREDGTEQNPEEMQHAEGR
jgi:hypothetical protein